MWQWGVSHIIGGSSCMDSLMIKNVTDVNNKYKELEGEYSSTVQITNYIFDNGVKLNYWELGVLVIVSKYNLITPITEELKTMPINISMIMDLFNNEKNHFQKSIISALDNLLDKGVINIDLLTNKYGDDKKYSNLFTVTQRFYTYNERFTPSEFEAFDGIEDFVDVVEKRSTTLMYHDEIMKILLLEESPSNKVKLLSLYVSICKPLFYYNKLGIDKGVKDGELRRAVSWEKIETIGKRVGFTDVKRSRWLLRLLVQNEVVGRFDVGFMGSTVFHTRVYLSRYADAQIMSKFVINQIKQGVVLNVFNENYSE